MQSIIANIASLCLFYERVQVELCGFDVKLILCRCDTRHLCGHSSLVCTSICHRWMTRPRAHVTPKQHTCTCAHAKAPCRYASPGAHVLLALSTHRTESQICSSMTLRASRKKRRGGTGSSWDREGWRKQSATRIFSSRSSIPRPWKTEKRDFSWGVLCVCLCTIVCVFV